MKRVSPQKQSGFRGQGVLLSSAVGGRNERGDACIEGQSMGSVKRTP